MLLTWNVYLFLKQLVTTSPCFKWLKLQINNYCKIYSFIQNSFIQIHSFCTHSDKWENKTKQNYPFIIISVFYKLYISEAITNFRSNAIFRKYSRRFPLTRLSTTPPTHSYTFLHIPTHGPCCPSGKFLLFEFRIMN